MAQVAGGSAGRRPACDVGMRLRLMLPCRVCSNLGHLMKSAVLLQSGRHAFACTFRWPEVGVGGGSRFEPVFWPRIRARKCDTQPLGCHPFGAESVSVFRSQNQDRETVAKRRTDLLGFARLVHVGCLGHCIFPCALWARACLGHRCCNPLCTGRVDACCQVSRNSCCLQ